MSPRTSAPRSRGSEPSTVSDPRDGSIHDDYVYAGWEDLTPGKRYGSAVPRLFTPPLRELTPDSSWGFELIDFARDVLGVTLDPWQRWLAVHMLELRGDGRLRFATTIIEVARQNGKSTFVSVMTLWFMMVKGWPLVLGTAQDLGTAEEVWESTLATLQDDEDLAPFVEKVIRVNGKKEFRLATHERYVVKAASRRAGRGMSGNLVILDELREQQNWLAWSAVTKTTNAQENRLIVGMSNAGDLTSVVLRHFRMMAHAAIGDPDGIVAAAGEIDVTAPTAADVDVDLEDAEDAEFYLDAMEVDEDTLFLAEWSAEPGCEKTDRKGWAQANPSLGYRMRIGNIASQISDPDWVFRCLDVATPVLTPRGFVRMDQLAVGDQVKGTNGEWVTVLGTSPVHHGRKCFRVTLNDGRSIVCDEDHLWTVRDRRRTGGYEVARTSDLVRRGVTYHNPSMDFDVRNFTLPAVAVLDGADVDLPVHPYLLGLWLGDGAKHAALIFTEKRDSAHVQSMIEHVGARIVCVRSDSENCDRISFALTGRGEFTTALRQMDVLNNKHIPDAYLAASAEQRLWLLRGLMDSDGTVTKRSGRSNFTNTNARLVAGVRTLVRSLGWKTSDIDGVVYGKDHWLPRFDVSFTTRPDEPAPVTIPRKLARIRVAKGSRDVRPATIASIEPVESVPVRCIQVDAEDSNFLAGDLVPTHNTEVLCQWVDTVLDGPFPAGSWEKGTNTPVAKPDGSQVASDEDRIVGELSVCLDVSTDRSMTYVAVCGKRRDGIDQGGVVAYRAGTDWVKSYLMTDSTLRGRIRAVTGQWNGAPVSPLIRELAAAAADPGDSFNLRVEEWSGAELMGGCATVFDSVRDVTVRHNPQPVLDAAAATASMKMLGDGFVLDRKNSFADVAPLMAFAGALWLHRKRKAAPKPAPLPPTPIQSTESNFSGSITGDVMSINF